MQELMNKYKKEIALSGGVLLFLFFYFLNPIHLENKANLVLSIGILMISWWVSEAMPLPVVALVPIVLFPLCGISKLGEVAKSYADSIIFLFMGGFFIGIAIEKWKLHKRVALGIINFTGTNGNRIILGFIISTAFLSLWLSNTATTMMMFPIAMSVIQVIGNDQNTEVQNKNFSLVLMLSIAYASNFAVGTIIATPPNVAYVNYIQQKFNYNIGFADWMIVFMPLSIALICVLYWVLIKLYPNNIKSTTEGKGFIENEIKSLGKISVPEKRVMYVFAFTVFLWICKDIINNVQKNIVLDDSIIAIAAAISMYMIPSGRSNTVREERLLEWKDTTQMAWGILLLFGGGIALAKALEEAKLMDKLGVYIASYATDNIFLMILLVTTVSVFLSEVMSNVAQVIVMAPVITSVGLAMHIDPLLLGLPMTLGASCASMLPMGTPPNAIVFASGHIRISDMMKTGLVLNILCILLITIFCWLLQPMILKMI